MFDINEIKSLLGELNDLSKRIEEMREELEEAKSYEKQLRTQLVILMNNYGLKTIDVGEDRISLRKPSPRLVVSNISKIPDDYKIPDFKIDKRYITKMLKDGHEVEGCKLEIPSTPVLSISRSPKDELEELGF